MDGRRWPFLLAALVSLTALLPACGSPSRPRPAGGGDSSSGGGDGPAGIALGFRPGDVDAVVVAWEPTLDRVPPPRRTTDQQQFAPLLQALAAVADRANPPDLLGPPVHITLELKDRSARHLELWGPDLADRDNNLLYGLSEEKLKTLRSALEPLSPPPIPAPARVSGMLTVADLVRALQVRGAGDAQDTGREIVPLFGARSGHVIAVLGQTVQVYVMESPEAAANAAAIDPNDMPVEWVAPPHFVAVGNLVVTVVVPDQEFARKILAYLQMVRGG